MPPRAKPPEDKLGKPTRALQPVPRVIDTAWSTPTPPPSVTDTALWDNLWELGGPSGVYNTVADYELITRYVEMVQRRRLLVNRLEAEGFVTVGSQGQEVQHPAARILADVESKLVPLEDRLGLSPQARHTIQIGHVKAKSALESWMDE